MTDNIRLEVVTPDSTIVSDEAKSVVAPGTLGDFGVLYGHTPFLTTLKAGAIRYTDKNGTEKLVFVSGGFAESLPEKVTILAESAEDKNKIDFDRARSAMERAQKRVSSDDSDIDILRAKAALERAMQRLKLT